MRKTYAMGIMSRDLAKGILVQDIRSLYFRKSRLSHTIDSKPKGAVYSLHGMLCSMLYKKSLKNKVLISESCGKLLEFYVINSKWGY